MKMQLLCLINAEADSVIRIFCARLNPSCTYRTTEDEDVHHTYKTRGKKNTASAFPGPSPNPNHRLIYYISVGSVIFAPVIAW